MKRLRAGVIGLGVGREHLAGYHRHPECEVVAVCDLDSTRLAETARDLPAVRLHERADDLLDDPAIDVVSIASYDDAHASQVMRAIRNGKHVFVEKPLCMTVDEARQIRDLLSEQSEVRLSSNLILRLSPRFQLLKRMIDAGEFGALFHIEGDYTYGRLHKITDGWRGRLPYYSAVLGGAVHLIDALLWLTGDRVVEVSAFGNAIASREADSDFAFNDMVVGILRFASGLVGKVSANFGCVMPHGHGLALFGTRATFVNGSPDGLLYTSRDPKEPPRRISAPHPGPPGAGGSKGDLISNFIDSILHGAEPIIPVEQVFDTMSVCLAIERSNLEGRPVRVEEVDVGTAPSEPSVR